MITLTFARYYAAVSFASMAEGMWEVRRDDAVLGDTQAQNDLKLWDEFVDALNAGINSCTPGPKAPLTFQVEDRFADLLIDTRDNCDDNAHDMGIDNETAVEENPGDAEDCCGAFEVTITKEDGTKL